VPGQAGASPVPATFDGKYDRLWNEVAGAPFMASRLRVRLEDAIVAAKQDTRAGKVDAATAQLQNAIATLQAGLKASQATQYTANRLMGEANAIITALQASQ
jgi:hypothetical protein